MNLSNKSSCSISCLDRYVSPYERLLKRNKHWLPKKVKEEKDLREKCRKGELTPFKKPDRYLDYFINRTTNIFVVDELIDKAELTNYYSVDTEGDPLTHQPAIIQVEFIRRHTTPVIIIIEAQHLPSFESPLFKKIQQLCSIIFGSKNTVYSWGSAKTELERYIPFRLFKDPIEIVERDLQWEYNPVQKYALQKLIQNEFKQYLDKTATVAEWSCGVDLLLGTYIPQDVVGPERTYRIHQERNYRTMLKDYAMNDVFAVTKWAFQVDQRVLSMPTPEIEEPNEPELIVHVQDELLDFNSDDFIQEEHLNEQMQIGNDEQTQIPQNEQTEMKKRAYSYHQNLPDVMRIHLENRSIEIINVEKSNGPSLPDIMIPYFGPKQTHQSVEQRREGTRKDEPKQVHVTDRVRENNFSNRNSSEEEALRRQLRNRKTNLRHRANRYRFEVIRKCYHKFKTTHVKRIIKSMNIKYKNINLVRHTAYIGVKEEDVDDVERQLHSRIFTEQHYYRLYG